MWYKNWNAVGGWLDLPRRYNVGKYITARLDCYFGIDVLDLESKPLHRRFRSPKGEAQRSVDEFPLRIQFLFWNALSYLQAIEPTS